ncbi:MAG TPA: PQQ-dependent dehydrogenase, methanol/ethanol family [Bryobacteraceae bacterium]|nr:PQQ-dependent dehydrogenase, methanol/ethanol family [Bryobacteraceae bacterium]
MRAPNPYTLAITVAVAALIASGQARRVDETVLKNAGKTGDEWLTYGLSQGETRYSPLKQIDATNVKRLGLAWAFDIGTGGGGQEATPLVANGTVYGITNWSIVFAVDARTGKERWRWDPEVKQTTVRSKICCGVVNRGLAIYQNLVIAPVIDGRLQAHDAETGKVVWEARVGYPQDGNTITMAPRIAKGKVLIGVSGGDRPTPGFFAAYDALTGREAWKFYTVPGDPSKGFENASMRKAAETWDGEWWKYGGGGAVWDGMAYDPDADLLYVGTGNAEPWPGELRKGVDAKAVAATGTQGKDNLYTASILAVQVQTGELKWHYQMAPGDSWDYDSVQQMILADININGTKRKVIMQANKNAFYYVIDRITGQFISAQPFSQATWAKGIDPKTGRPIVNPEMYYGTDSILITPGGGGAHNWSPMSYNPTTGLTYIPTSTLNTFTYAADPAFDPGKNTNTGTKRSSDPPKLTPPPAIGPPPLEGTARGALVAWDPVTQQMRWRQPGGGGIGGGTVTTAGNLVFQTVNDGRLLAYSADKGEKLLEIATGLRSGMGPPITYMLDGKQYVALMGGVGTVGAGGAGPGNQATPLHPHLLVFVLDGTAQLPTPPPASPPAATAAP